MKIIWRKIKWQEESDYKVLHEDGDLKKIKNEYIIKELT